MSNLTKHIHDDNNGLDYTPHGKYACLTWSIPEVVQVVPYEDKKIIVYFHDGAVRLFDVQPLIKPGTVFGPLMEDGFFRIRLTVMNQTVSWDISGDQNPEMCVDIDPITIYSEGEKITGDLKEYQGC